MARHDEHIGSVKIPFPTICRRPKDQTKADDPSSVLHLSISVRELEHSRDEPCIVNELLTRCKCRARTYVVPLYPADGTQTLR